MGPPVKFAHLNCTVFVAETKQDKTSPVLRVIAGTPTMHSAPEIAPVTVTAVSVVVLAAQLPGFARVPRKEPVMSAPVPDPVMRSVFTVTAPGH